MTVKCEHCNKEIGEIYIIVIVVTPNHSSVEYYCGEECQTIGDD